jgi:hypothetical protein
MLNILKKQLKESGRGKIMPCSCVYLLYVLNLLGNLYAFNMLGTED